MKIWIKLTFLSLLFFCVLLLGNIDLDLNTYYFTNSISSKNAPGTSSNNTSNNKNGVISIASNHVLAASIEGTSVYGNIPKTIVNIPHDISGNSGRKIVLLSNGWLVAATKYYNSGYLYVSRDNGITWSQLCTITSGFYGSYAITSYGTEVYVIGNTSTAEKVWIIDVETQANVNIESKGIVIDSGQTSFGSGCSITADDNGILHAVWNSKNSSYSNSFNLRYSKSVNYGQSWSLPVQLSSINITTGSVLNPSIVTRNNIPVIICEGNGVKASNQSIIASSGAQSIMAASFDENTVKWNFYNIYSVSTNVQDAPSMCITNNGNIHVAWHGKDSDEDSIENIKYSTSSDGGTTWTTPIKVARNDSYSQRYPSITCDRDNNIYIFYQINKETSYYNIYRVSCLNGTWGSPYQITNNSSNHAYYPQAVYARELSLNTGEPLVMWQDYQAGAILFRGRLAEWYINEIYGTVISGLYKISGNSGKKIVKLKDGILISALQDTANHKIMLYQSRDNGITWMLLKEDIAAASIQDVVLTELTDGNIGYLLLSDNKYVSFKKVNKDNFEFMHETKITFELSSNAVCSVAKGNDGILHAVWSGIVPTKTGYYTIWYSKSADDGLTWDVPVALTEKSTPSHSYNPCIVINKNNEPTIIFSYVIVQNISGFPFTSYNLGSITRTNGAWESIKPIQDNSSYLQKPSVTIDMNGTIHCVYENGSQSMYSNSADSGSTWSTPKLISGDISFKNPTIVCNKYNEVFVLGSSNTNGFQMNINMIRRDIKGIWSSISMLTNNKTASADFPQIAQSSNRDFQIPEFIYLNNQSNSIVFQSMLNNTLPYAEIISPTMDETLLLNGETFEIRIKVRDETNKSLDCKYYFDDETVPREIKSVSDTCVLKEVAFTPVDMNLLLQGKHSIRLQVSNQDYTYETVEIFNIDNELPSIGASIVSTDNSITIYGSGADTGNLNSIPYRYSIGSAAGEWTNEAAFTWDNLEPDTLYSITFEVRDYAGNISVYGKDVYTRSQIPEISISNITSTSLDLNINDSNPETTLYQINLGTKYVNENCKLTDIPVWVMIPGKKLSVLDLTPNSRYSLTVRTKNGENEESQYSMPIDIETISITLSMPLNISINTSATSAVLTWTGVEGAVEYEVEADGLIKSVRETTFKHTGLVPNTQHSYKVRAKNYHGYSDWSSMETVITEGSITNEILDIHVFPFDTTVTLTWNMIEDAQSYEVEFDGKVIDNGLNTFCTKGGLLPKSNHTYRVRAINSAGEGLWSEMQDVTTCLLSTPSNIEIIEDENEIKLAWDKTDNAIEYVIEVNGNSLITTSDNIFVHTGLTTEKTYIYRIKARNNEGESGWSRGITAATLPVRPGIPVNITAHSVQNIITITWDKVENAIGYDVELDGVLIDNGNSLIYIHEDLSACTYHKYRVRAKNAAVEGKWSELLNIKTMEGKPKYPGKVKVDSTTTITNLSWESQNDALGYDVEVDGEIIENITKPTYTHRRITPGTEHLYRVRTRNITGTSSWSGYIINNALRAVCKKDRNLDLGLTASDIIDFSKYTLKVTYNPDVIEVMDLSTLSSKIELKEGRIEGTGVTITSFKAGEIVFIVDKSIPPGESWSGVINSIKFRAKVSGGTNITYTVYGAPEDIQ